MDTAWPWLAVAGLGALHGLNPATGWALAAAWAAGSGDRRHALGALLPLALGHLASVGGVAGAMALGMALDRPLLLAAAVGLSLAMLALHLRGRHRPRQRRRSAQASLALWSFAGATGHGAGLMLVPVLMPICSAANAAGAAASRPLWSALAAVALHAAAMLAVTGLLASGACRGVDHGRRCLGRCLRRLSPADRRPA